MQIGVLKWLQFTKQKGVHFPMQFLEPKNKNAKSVDWEISEDSIQSFYGLWHLII